MKILVVIAGAVAIIAVVVGVVAWSASGAEARCDHQALRAAMHERIGVAETRGMTQVHVDMPEACTDDDMADMMPEVSRSWHVMPGGALMRESMHTSP
jgi:hypothetical protein